MHSPPQSASAVRNTSPDEGLSSARSVPARGDRVFDDLDRHPVSVVSDAIGLAAFTTAGATVVTDAGVSAFGIVAVAAINACGGAAFADILLDRSPCIRFDDCDASCSSSAVSHTGRSSLWRFRRARRGRRASDCLPRAHAVTDGKKLPIAQVLGIVGKQVGDTR
ncbi:TRIC cation channel family protein [Haloarcula montana]|uniref:TRIC cation channel family protein n=1 Tax=Haloarcula montana TaxID=3111776 RepID=UPI002D7A009E|nr:TRIC cation channel family protein [Haloarcula sp. GH36]